jgi:hypothetical protein
LRVGIQPAQRGDGAFQAVRAFGGPR